MVKPTIASLLAHKGRVALTALAIVLGVSFVSGSFILTDTLRATFDDLFGEALRGTDVAVRSVAAFQEESNTGSTNREPLPESLLDVVAAVEGVREAGGLVQGYAQFVDADGEAVGGMGPPTLGFNWPGDSALSPFTIRAGRGATAPDEVVIDAGTAKASDFEVGDTVTVLLAGPPEHFTIVGIAGFGEADNLAGATVALFETRTAQRIFHREGQYGSIGVAAEPGVSAAELRERIAAVLPDSVEAITQQQSAEEAASTIQSGFAFFSTALLAFAGISLFVGAFIIHNTFSILVAQRTRELGLLRALGASRRQVIGSVVAEAGFVGLLASVVGLLAGLGMAVGLQALLAGFGIDLPSTTTQFLPRTVIVSMVLGVGVTVVSSLGPARRAARVAPVEALAEGEHPAPAPRVGRRAAAGGAISVVGTVVLVGGLTAGAGFPLVALGGLLLFVGVAMLSPLIAAPVVRALGAPASLLGLPSRLGRENALRNPRRTASTAAALMVGLGMVSFAAVFAASMKASSTKIIDDALRADLFVESESVGGMSTAVADELAAEPAVGSLSPLRFGAFKLAGEMRSLTAVGPNIDELLAVDMTAGEVSALGDGQLLVDDEVAEEENWSVGDTVTLEFARTGAQQVVIGGTFDRVQLVGRYIVSTDVFAANYSTVLDGVVLMNAARGSSIDELRASANRVAARYPNLEVKDQAQFKADQIAQVNQLLGLVTVLLTLAIIIAVMGIVNTLALSVLERTREIGLLRAVGMARRQVGAMIRVESVLVAVLGGLLGIVVGIGLGWLVVQSLSGQGFDLLRIPAGRLLMFLVSSGVVGVAAALLPARKAARMDILPAIHRP
jgi:putative ABC transport system permease protein